MKVSLLKTSFIDYPAKMSSVIFFSGCNLRCPWCHNGDLVLGIEDEALIPIEDAIKHVQKRSNIINAVVLSGGEPTLYSELPDLIQQLKELGLLIKLDTNGMNPGMLEKLFQNENTKPDYIALDLKTAPDRYPFFTKPIQCADRADANITKSAFLINNSGISHEFRTLVFPRNIITENDIESLSLLVDGSPWYFRPFRQGNCLDPEWNNLEDVTKEEIEKLAYKAQILGKQGMCFL